jgi:hypothetical protein
MFSYIYIYIYIERERERERKREVIIMAEILKVVNFIFLPDFCATHNRCNIVSVNRVRTLSFKAVQRLYRKSDKQTNKNKLRGLQSANELYRLNDRHLSAKFNANFCG